MTNATLRTNAYPGTCTNCSQTVPTGEGVLSGQRGAWTTTHVVCPPKPAVVGYDPQSIDVGVYVHDGTIVKVQPNKAKTYKYALRWYEINGDRLRDADETIAHGDWEYDRGLVSDLGTARRMTLDEAKAFILRYGKCVRCGRRLKAAESVERGIGPICVEYFNFGS